MKLGDKSRFDPLNYLREKPLKDHSIVICFFGKWSVERKDVRSIEHHSISDLYEKFHERIISDMPCNKSKMKLERKCWIYVYMFCSMVLNSINPTIANSITELFLLSI